MKYLTKRMCALTLVGGMLFSLMSSLAGCSPQESASTSVPPASQPAATPEITSYSLDFSEQVESWEKETASKTDLTYYKAEAVYCENPTHPKYQMLRLYVPEAYFNDDGTINTENTVGNYTAQTAPIIYINSYGGYQGNLPYGINTDATQAGTLGWYYEYLRHGFVICFVGERGINITNSDKEVIGRGAVGLADLKAGIRFLKHNSGKFPGDTDRIISSGVSAGGAMSSLIGTTGNSTEYDEYLKEMGACMDETDDVFAAQAYCPIIDLEHAPLAYEWMWAENTDYSTYSDFTAALTDKFTVAYAAYVNGLGLVDENGQPLTLSEDGTKQGSFCDWMLEKYEAAFVDYVVNQGKGAGDVEKYDWLTYDEAAGQAAISAVTQSTPMGELVMDYNARYKSCVAFDDLDYGFLGDNGVFGLPNTKMGQDGASRHFSQDVADIIGGLQEEFPEEYAQYYQVYYDESHNEDVVHTAQILNPYNYVADGQTDTAQHFRITVGTTDPHTSPSASAIFALLLQMSGVDVEYELMWNQIHTDADTATGLIEWVDALCG